VISDEWGDEVGDLNVQIANKKDLDAIVPLFAAQEARHYALDPRLERPRSAQAIRQMLAGEFDDEGEPLIVRDQVGAVRGFVIARIFEIPAGNAMLSFYTARNGSHRALTLPDPAAPDAIVVAGALLAALDHQWQAWQTSADLLTWPSADRWLEPLLHRHNFVADSIVAWHPNAPLAPSSHPPDQCLRVRLAQPADEQSLVALHLGGIQFHTDHGAHVRVVAGVEEDFREKLARLWQGQSPEVGAPLVVVVEQQGEVVAMSENYIEQSPGWGALSRFPPGRYGYLNSVSVRADKHGQGIGRLLTQGAIEAFAPYKVDAFGLWYMPANPISSKFWPHVGFTPLWTQYRRAASEELRWYPPFRPNTIGL
jgi:ribosomal protein S18 acetylase RimI-like enzyme